MYLDVFALLLFVALERKEWAQSCTCTHLFENDSGKRKILSG
jgi:hypothetical protein